MLFEDNKSTTSAKNFKQAITIINLITIVQFFKTIYTRIFNWFLAPRSIKNSF